MFGGISMFYDRKIKYLDYYENGGRVKGGGFIKLEARDGRLRVEVSVNGLHATDTFVRDVLLCGKGQEGAIGKITVKGGRGQFRQVYGNLEDINGTGIGYSGMQGIRVPLGGGRELSCVWDGQRMQAEGGASAGGVSVGGPDRGAGIGSAVDRGAGGGPAVEEASLNHGSDVDKASVEGSAVDKGSVGSSVVDNALAIVQTVDNAAAETRIVDRGSADRSVVDNTLAGEAAVTDLSMSSMVKGHTGTDRAAGNKIKMAEHGLNGRQADTGRTAAGDRQTGAGERQPVKLLEDKWQQLCAIYPHVAPFHDIREYLSISPADFVIFPSASYKLVNNSFLLHGYYNYRHLILARMEKKGEICYYVGVPGTFFEKEKQVAVMFGFESFECGEEPAQTGDFGYYMMRIQL